MSSNVAKSDLKVLWHLLAHRVRGQTHQERLDSFYAGQADHYDSFRKRLLHGREELIQKIDFPDGGTWVDLGCGTGENLQFAGEAVGRLAAIHLVDLSKSLIAVADQRIGQNHWSHAQTHLVDATQTGLPPASADVVTFSYSLTMIPNWFDALMHAKSLLRPGGKLAVVDFYVSRKHADDDQTQHGWFRRTFWSLWFAADNVFLNGDHLAMIESQFKIEFLAQRDGKVPYIPLLRAPHYLCIASA